MSGSRTRPLLVAAMLLMLGGLASVADYSREALERGAVGYALKPVKREQLVDALNALEAKFSQGLRHVLVVGGVVLLSRPAAAREALLSARADRQNNTTG